MIRNNEKEYGTVAKFFHWLIALGIITLLSMGYIMEGRAVVNIHQLIGLTVLTFAVPRIIWKLMNRDPKLPDGLLKIEKIAAKTVQVLLYVCMFAMPISGWIMGTAYGLIPHIGDFYMPFPGVGNDQELGNIFSNIHYCTSFALLGLFGMHVAGALKHTFIDKDPSVIKSMLPKFKK